MMPLCVDCREFVSIATPPKCTAFHGLEGIPEAILSGAADHRKPYPGDGGIRFKSI